MHGSLALVNLLESMIVSDEPAEWFASLSDPASGRPLSQRTLEQISYLGELLDQIEHQQQRIKKYWWP